MAVGGTKLKEYDETISQENYQEQNDELLALQSIYDESSVRSVQVLNTSTEEDGGIRSLFITIPVPQYGQELAVKVERSEDDLRDGTSEETTAQYSGNSVRLEKYGDGKHGPLQVKHLPPFTLQAVLPPTYPSQDAPDFTLSCVWLTANQLSALCGQLDRLWEESQKVPVLFTWIDWLENNIFSYLEIGTTVTVSVDETCEVDSRVQRNHNIREALEIIMHYNCSEENEAFRLSSHECPVCCEVLPGGQLYRLDDCGHYFCVDCLTDYCLHHVTEGSVEKLRCPDTECDFGLPPHIVQSVLPADQFDRWERLLLQRTLEGMTDMDWCPRCNHPVIREMEEELNLGHCTTCYFSFCTTCRDPWHQGEPCTIVEDELEDLEEVETVEEQLAVALNQTVMSAADREHFEERRRKLEEEFRSRLGSQKKYKLCPNCRVKIEKTGGCNMMKCRCGTSFCWLCGVAVSYSHFRMGSSRCNLLDLRGFTHMAGDITPQNVDYVENLVYGPPPDIPRVRPRPRPTRPTSKCPSCRYMNVKTDRNNHMKCRCCSINYCYICGVKIVGIVTAHFIPGHCPNHS